MYEVEGYGGNEYNGGVSSIAEKNVIRVLGGENQTGYRNENILVHEFGHSVKSLGMDLLEDQSLHDEFMGSVQQPQSSWHVAKHLCHLKRR